MSTQFAKPENALKRAEELISIGNKGDALQVLHSVITSKKFRVWQPVMEKIMLKYISLCVEMRKGKIAKDGLHQYKSTVQQSNFSSLEVVVKHFLAQAEDRAKEAQSKAEKIILDIEDLEADETVESAMLSSVSGEDSKDRTDREVVTPWLKFLWETYRTVLDILRNNNKFEAVYQTTASQAFKFCAKYKRHTEFRRLSDMLRNHLGNTNKFPNQPHSINLSIPESLQSHVDVRFEQYQVACDLELWQEAFKSIEDIHGLLATAASKKGILKLQTVANYYQKLAQILWLSENYLFHAYALNKYFAIYKKNMSEEDIKMYSSSVLLATMSIPLEERVDPYEFTAQTEKNIRISTLLSLNNIPLQLKRETMIEELTTRNIFNQVYPELKEFFSLMEKKLNPLQFGGSIKPKLDFISTHPQLKIYVKPLENLMFVRLLQQLARVYDTIKLSEFNKLIYFTSLHEVERLVVEAVKKGYVDVRLDHQNGALIFKSQTFESPQLRHQLAVLSKNLQQAVQMIQPEKYAEASYKQRKQESFAKIMDNLREEHERVLARKVAIEKKKEKREQAERLKAQQEEEERRKKQIELEQQEQERLNKLAEERDIIKQKKDAEDKKRKELQAYAAIIGQSPEDTTALETIDVEELMKKKIEQHEKEQVDLATRLKKLGKKMDWFERARLHEERPLLLQAYEKQKEDDKRFFEEQTTEFIKTHKEKWEKGVEEKKRLIRMVDDKNRFEEMINKRRREEYEKLKKERDERIAVKRAKYEEEKQKRMAEEAERRAEQERQRKIQEEEDRKKREELEAKRKEDEEKRRKLDEKIALQRKREEEALARARERELEDTKKKEEKVELKRAEEPWRPRSIPRDDRDWRDRRDRSPPRDDRDWRDRPAPVRRDRSPPRRDRSPPPRDDRDWRDRPAPVRRDRSPLRRDRSPPRRDRSPPPRDRSPPPRDRSPPPRDRSPPRRDRSPPRRDRSPPRRDRSPIRRDRSPPRRDRSPPRRDRSPPRRDRSPPRRDRSPPRRDKDVVSPRDRDAPRSQAPPRRDAPPQDRRPPPPRRDAEEEDDGFMTVGRKKR